MFKVVNEFSIGKYKILSLNKEIPLRSFKGIRIDGKDFAVTMPYDLKQSIAIEADGNFIDKEIEFI